MKNDFDIYEEEFESPKKVSSEKRPHAVATFIKYNNTVPIVLGFIFLGTSGALAASPAVRDSVYTSTQSTKSIDNSYIRTVNLDSFPFTVLITNVREDADSYYVSYTLHTIDVVDSVWKSVDKPMTFSVKKIDLHGQDLGSYTSKQVAEVRDYERYRFTTAQTEERKKGPSQKILATQYSGLIGSFLSSREEALPGYAHEDTPPPQEVPGSDPNRLATPQAAPTFDANAPVAVTPAAVGAAQVPAPAPASPYVPVAPTPTPTPALTPQATPSPDPLVDTTAPVVSMLGGSFITVPVGDAYTDLGAVASDNATTQPTLHTFVNGVEVGSVTIPTSAPEVFIIKYTAKDAAGNVGSATRTVTVVASAPPAPAPVAPEPPPAQASAPVPQEPAP